MKKIFVFLFLCLLPILCFGQKYQWLQTPSFGNSPNDNTGTKGRSGLLMLMHNDSSAFDKIDSLRKNTLLKSDTSFVATKWDVYKASPASFFISKEGTNYVGSDLLARVITKSTTFKTVLRAGVNAVPDSGVIFIKNGVYQCPDSIIIQKSIKIIGEGNVNIYNTVLTNPLLSFYGTVINTVTTKKDIPFNKDSVWVNGIGTLKAGDLIGLYDDTYEQPTTFPTWKRGELHEVRYASNDTILIKDNLLYPYLTSKNAIAVLIRPITVEIENINIIGVNKREDYKAIHLLYVKNGEISNCNLTNNGYYEVNIYHCFNTYINKCTFGDNILAGVGYGVMISNSSAYTYLDNCTFYNSRHTLTQGGVSSWGQPRNTIAFKCTFNNLGGADILVHNVDAHAQVHDFTLNTCIINCGYGMYAVRSGALFTTIVNCKIYGGGIAPQTAMSFSADSYMPKGLSFNIDNNEFYTSKANGSYSYGSTTTDSLLSFNYTNNKHYGTQNYYIYLENAKNFDISDNKFYSDSLYGANAVYVYDSYNGMINHNFFKNIKANPILLSNVTNTTVSTNIFSNYSSGGTYVGITLTNSIYNVIINNTLIASRKAYTYRHGIVETGTSNYNTIINNNVEQASGTPEKRIVKLGANTFLFDNKGYNSNSDVSYFAYSYVISKLNSNYVGYSLSTGIATVSTSFKTILRAGINAIVDSGTIFIRNGNYILTDSIIIQKNIDITGESRHGVKINWTQTGKEAFRCEGTLIRTTTLTGNILAGTDTVNVTSAASALVGDLIVVYDNTIWDQVVAHGYTAWKTGEIHEIANINGNRIITSDEYINGYTIAQSAVVLIYRPIKVNISNINIIGTSATADQRGIGVVYCKDVTISNSTIDSVGLRGVWIMDSYNIIIDRCVIADNLMGGYGYGVSSNNATAYVTVKDCYFRSQRHGTTSGGVYTYGQPRKLNYYHNTFVNNNGTGQAIDAHSCTEDITCDLNTIEMKGTTGTPRYAISSGAKINIISRNTITGGTGIMPRDVNQLGVSFYISDNDFYDCQSGFLYSSTADSINDLVMDNNRMYKKSWRICQAINVKHAVLTNNKLFSTETSGETGSYGIGLFNCRNALIAVNYIHNTYSYGIYLDSVDFSLVTTNYIYDYDRHGYSTFYPGIYLSKSDHNVVSGNILFRQKTTYIDSKGILEGGNSNFNRVHHNNVEFVGNTEAYRIVITGAGSTQYTNDGYTL
jgi:hypothetical protein